MTSKNNFYLAQRRKAVSRWVKQSKTLEIFVIGKLGTGKSSLINSLLNREVTQEGYAEEGYSLYGVTKSTNSYGDNIKKNIRLPEFRLTIHNIHVTLWDTPGLQDPCTDKSKILEDIKANVGDNADLYVYCTQMTQTRAEQGDIDAIADLTEALGKDFWKRAIFAMTFANQVTKPPNYSKTKEEYFEERLKEWSDFLHGQVQGAGVECRHAKSIPVIPVSYRDLPLPTGGNWFTEFWRTCIATMKFVSIPAFLTVNQEWIDRDTDQVLAARVISERLKTIGDQIEESLVKDLSGITEEDFILYLRDAILTSTNGDDELRDTPAEASPSYLKPLTYAMLLVGICFMIGLLLQRSRH